MGKCLIKYQLFPENHLNYFWQMSNAPYPQILIFQVKSRNLHKYLDLTISTKSSQKIPNIHCIDAALYRYVKQLFF